MAIFIQFKLSSGRLISINPDEVSAVLERTEKQAAIMVNGLAEGFAVESTYEETIKKLKIRRDIDPPTDRAISI